MGLFDFQVSMLENTIFVYGMWQILLLCLIFEAVHG